MDPAPSEAAAILFTSIVGKKKQQEQLIAAFFIASSGPGSFKTKVSLAAFSLNPSVQLKLQRVMLEAASEGMTVAIFNTHGGPRR